MKSPFIIKLLKSNICNGKSFNTIFSNYSQYSLENMLEDIYNDSGYRENKFCEAHLFLLHAQVLHFIRQISN